MNGFFVFVSSILRRKIFWVSPILFLVLTITPRFLNMPLVSLLCMSLAFAVAFISLFMGVIGCFSYGDDIRKEVIFYKSLGLGFLQQFFMRLAFLFIWALFLYFAASSVMWVFDLNLFILAITMVFSFMLFYSLASFVGNRFIGYLPLALYIASIFLPMYVTPNPAYIIKASVGDAFMYSSMYVLFYLISSYKFFVLSWRKQCIGSIR